MSRFYLPLIGFLFFSMTSLLATQHTIRNEGLRFVPEDLVVEIGDTVNFEIGGSHNAMEVSKEDYDARRAISNGGFQVAFGGGTIVITEAKTYYYVCMPHVTLDMVGTIVANAPAETETYSAVLSGTHEVFPVSTLASGQVNATLEGTTLTVEGSFTNLSGAFNFEIAQGSHIHKGFAGQNGGIEFTLVPTLNEDQLGGTFDAANNTFELSIDQVGLLKSRQMYINIHTTAFPSGELRGQLLPKSDALYLINLFGSNQVPSIISRGHGALNLEVTGDSLFVSGAFSDLEGAVNTEIAGGLHLHNGLAGENGGIAIVLDLALDSTGTAGTINGAYQIADSVKMMLENRMIYANLHTLAYGSGELRGQVRSIANAIFRTHLSGSNEVNPVTSAATGELLFELNGNILGVSGTFKELSSALNVAIAGGVHIHAGLAGRNGGVEFPLVVQLSSDSLSGKLMFSENQFELSESQVTALMDRSLYVNVHSTQYGAGEIRGQIVPESQMFFNGFLSGNQEVTPVQSGGSGNVQIEVNGNALTISGSFNQMDGALNEAIGAHIHLGLAGQNGPVQFPLNFELSEDKRSGVFNANSNKYDLSDGLLDTLIGRGFYVNVHSTIVPSGELRAQLLHEATSYFYAPLSGSSGTLPVNSSGKGAVVMEWNKGRILLSGAFADLQSDLNTEILGGVHLHFGLPGQSGPVLLPIQVTQDVDNRSGIFEIENNSFEVSAGFQDTIFKRMVYVNVHSIDLPPGEIRGQVLPYANNYFTATLSGYNEVQPIISTGNGAFKLVLNGSELTVSGSFSDLIGDFDPTIGGGAHIHEAITGENGGVVLPIIPELNDDNKGGQFNIDQNTFTLEPEQVEAIRAGKYYFNIHTTQVASGEIRGQILPEVNQFPTASSIISPVNEAEIVIGGAEENTFSASWESSMDRDTVSYVWQLAIDSTFGNPLLSINTKHIPSFETDFNTIDSLLIDRGLEIGQMIQLFHRVIAIDGSLNSFGDLSSIFLKREIVAVREQIIMGETNVYPNPSAAGQFVLEVNAVQSTGFDLRVVNLLGQTLLNRSLKLNNGYNSVNIDLGNSPDGTYYIQLLSKESNLLDNHRVVIGGK